MGAILKIAMNRLLQRIIPFVILGIMIVIFVVGLVVFSYLLIFGALIGLILFVIAWIREKIFPSKPLTKIHRGRIIDHDDEP